MAKTVDFFWQRGESLDYVNRTDELIESGTIIALGSKIGVAACEIAPGAVGSVHVEGVFKFAKGSGALAQGVAVTITNGTAAAAESGSEHGYVAFPAAASDTTVLVKINA